MNKEDIIKLAEESGFASSDNAWIWYWLQELERFARAAYERGVADERERMRSLYESTISPASPSPALRRRWGGK